MAELGRMWNVRHFVSDKSKTKYLWKFPRAIFNEVFWNWTNINVEKKLSINNPHN